MHRTAIAAIFLFAGLAAAPAFAMGSGGGGGMGGGYGGAFGAQTSDEYSTALKLIRREKYADAIPHLQRALLEKPHSADIFNYLGYTERMTGNYPASLSYYQSALKENPDHKGAHEYLGELYLNMHDLASANGQLAELTRLCPSNCEEKDVLTKSIATYQSANTPAASPQKSSSP